MFKQTNKHFNTAVGKVLQPPSLFLKASGLFSGDSGGALGNGPTAIDSRARILQTEK